MRKERFSSRRDNTKDVEQISDQITFIDGGKILDSADKETFLDRWRRLRLVLPESIALPHLPGVIDVGGSSRLPVLTTNRFDPAMLSVCQDLGATVQAVDNMTLEEIFCNQCASPKGDGGGMNIPMIRRLILKDWYMQRWLILGSVLGGLVALGIVCLGGQAAFTIGIILLITALVAVGAQLAIATMVNERKEQTLSFVMSLPISYVEYTMSKLLGTVLIFMVPWTLLVLGSFALFAIPHGVPHGLFPFTAIMATEILVNTCLIIAVALVTESQPWTVGAIMVGNIGINVIGFFIAHLPGIARGMGGTAMMWSSTASVALVVEFAMIALLLGLTFFFQSRKRDFL